MSTNKALQTRTIGYGRGVQAAVPYDPHALPAGELKIPPGERKYIQTLEESHCRWPIGDPQIKGFHFCGRQKVPGLVYCDFHVKRAYMVPQPRRR